MFLAPPNEGQGSVSGEDRLDKDRERRLGRDT